MHRCSAGTIARMESVVHLLYYRVFSPFFPERIGSLQPACSNLTEDIAKIMDLCSDVSAVQHAADAQCNTTCAKHETHGNSRSKCSVS